MTGPDPDTADDPTADPDEDVEVRPWWQSPLNLVTVAIAIAVLAGGVGYLVGNNRATPDPNAADIGFLHDMRFHHEQAVQMGLIYLDDAGIDGDLAVIAREIVMGQSIEIGRMIQLLRDFGAPEASETTTAMAWMGAPVDDRQMPGYATDAQLQSLATVTGGEADRLFVQLMVAHHQGGIHMAQEATTRAADHEVIAMAASMASGQRDEITELLGLVAP